MSINQVKLRYFKIWGSMIKIKQDGNLYIIMIMVYVNVEGEDSFTYTQEESAGYKGKYILKFFDNHIFLKAFHCVKSVRIWSYSVPYSVRMRENMNQNNSEYGHFSRSVC